MSTPTQTWDSLAAPVFEATRPLSPALRQLIVDSLWPTVASSIPSQIATTESLEDFNTYFDFLTEEKNESSRQAPGNAINTYEELIFIVETLRTNPSSTLASIITLMQNSRPGLTSDPTKLIQSIELAVRVWLMLDIRHAMPSDRQSLSTLLPWPITNTLMSTIQPVTTKSTTADPGGMFSEYLNVFDMNKIAKMRVEWTDNLVSHLETKGSVVYVFHNVSVLKRMRSSSSNNSILPGDFIDETLATIDLLVPLSKASCNAWLAQEIKKNGADANLVHFRNSPRRDKADYVYWCDKLEAIEMAFEKRRPTGIFQWWYDTRDRQAWWSFWLVAAGIFLTVLFGFIQSVTGIIQVVNS